MGLVELICRAGSGQWRPHFGGIVELLCTKLPQLPKVTIGASQVEVDNFR